MYGTVRGDPAISSAGGTARHRAKVGQVSENELIMRFVAPSKSSALPVVSGAAPLLL
jgi:hypothetical protein